MENRVALGPILFRVEGRSSLVRSGVKTSTTILADSERDVPNCTSNQTARFLQIKGLTIYTVKLSFAK
jgi:hypothetical protein